MRKIQSPFFSAVFILLSYNFTYAQITGPEQDCGDAIAVCQTVYVQNQSYQGTGAINDLLGTNSCLQNKENNSVWYIFTVTVPGILVFNITPFSTDDYDFALYNLTNASCADIFNGTPGIEVRCNYAFTNGATGLRAGFTNASEGPGGQAFCAPLNVSLGETYALLVDNFSSTSSGYTLDFNPSNGSTASIIDFTKPEIASIQPLACDNTDSLIITFSEPVRCNSLAADGSDFQITGPSPVTITGAYSPDCASGSFTLSAIIRFSTPITLGGAYNLGLKVGTDGNTVADNCGNEADPAQTPFTVPDIVSANFTFTKSSSCVADTFRFTNTSTGNVTSVLWNFGDANNTTSTDNNPEHVYPVIGTYTVTLIANTADCADTFANATIDVTNSFIASFSVNPAEPCAAQPANFTNTSSAVGTNYIWQFGDGNISSQENDVHTYANPGTYNVCFTILDLVLQCGDTTCRDITVRPNVRANFTSDASACVNLPVNFSDASLGTPAAWTWTFPGGATSTTQNTTFTFTSTGTFPVELDVTDAFCGTDDTILNITVLPLPVFSLGNDTLICLSENVTLIAVSGADSYLWSTGATTQMIDFNTPPAEVWATAFLNGCPYTDTIFVNERTVDCSFAIVPTGFSPNGDGKNDVLRVLTKRVSEYEIIIYNRWGQEVYRGTNNDFGWDGSFKDEPQDIGVFSYILTWRNLSGQKFIDGGSVTLVR